MLEPVGEIELGGKTYKLGTFTAIKGREILTQYPTTAMPKIGDYKTNEALMLDVLAHVGVVIEGRDEPQMLNTAALINNHVKGAENLMRLEWAMMQHNFASLKNGKASGFLEALARRVQDSIGSTLIQLLARSQGKG